MIAAPAIGNAPMPEMTLAAGPAVDATATGFASIMQAVAPVGTGAKETPQQPALPELQSAAVDVPATAEPVEKRVQSLPAIVKATLPAPSLVAGAGESDGPEIVVQGGGLPVALPDKSRPPSATSKNMPQKSDAISNASFGDELFDFDQIAPEPTEKLILAQQPIIHRTAELPVSASNPEKPIVAPPAIVPSPDRVVAAELPVPKLATQIDRVEVQMPVTELRGPSTVPLAVADKPLSYPVDRAVTFAPMLVQIARDVLALSADRDVRFNLRPDVLGPVAVTIERTEAGPNLRLGVETHAAVQAVRAAEPMLNDSRSAAPFVQVTVDMNAPDQRSRNGYRPVAVPRRGDGHSTDNIIERSPVVTGRYA